MIVGYAQVSSTEQNPGHRADAPARADVDRTGAHVGHDRAVTTEDRALFAGRAASGTPA
ncbi:hypothetical protein [Streptosporangium sp. NPDC023615]|uniref:hypothetical protein n=1 Tax=Streptosporangium sp. NPDC023615 TaxID=3154794 RepID=UPI00341D8CC5